MTQSIQIGNEIVLEGHRGIRVGMIILGISIPLSFYLSFYWLRHVRMIEDVPTAKIRSAAQGYVELEAIARERDGHVQRSPVSGKKCLWWAVDIERRVPLIGFWKLVDTRQSSATFYIEDDTGICLVDPTGARFETIASEQCYYGASSDLQPSLAHGKRPASGKYRYLESIIEPDTPLHLIGQFVTPKSQAADTKAGPHSHLNTAASVQTPMLCKPLYKHQTYLISIDSQHNLCRRLRIASGVAIVWSFGAAVTLILFMLNV